MRNLATDVTVNALTDRMPDGYQPILTMSDIPSLVGLMWDSLLGHYGYSDNGALAIGFIAMLVVILMLVVRAMSDRAAILRKLSDCVKLRSRRTVTVQVITVRAYGRGYREV